MESRNGNSLLLPAGIALIAIVAVVLWFGSRGKANPKQPESVTPVTAPAEDGSASESKPKEPEKPKSDAGVIVG